MTIKQYDTNISFWELFPILKKHSAFKDLYSKDKSRGKLPSSNMMWAFALYVDISPANTFRNESAEDRLDLINEDYLTKTTSLDLVKYKDQLAAMSKLLMPRKKAVLKNYLDKLDERAQLLQDTSYSLENATVLDKLIENTDKLYTAISNIEASLENEEEGGAVKGGRHESLSEQGKL